jgi:hypothetical protein
MPQADPHDSSSCGRALTISTQPAASALFVQTVLHGLQRVYSSSLHDAHVYTGQA